MSAPGIAIAAVCVLAMDLAGVAMNVAGLTGAILLGGSGIAAFDHWRFGQAKGMKVAPSA